MGTWLRPLGLQAGCTKTSLRVYKNYSCPFQPPGSDLTGLGWGRDWLMNRPGAIPPCWATPQGTRLPLAPTHGAHRLEEISKRKGLRMRGPFLLLGSHRGVGKELPLKQALLEDRGCGVRQASAAGRRHGTNSQRSWEQQTGFV